MKKEVRDKLKTEIKANLGSDIGKYTEEDWQTSLSYDSINIDSTWNYLIQIITETLRIEPPARFTTKQALVEDQTINGMRIKKGDIIIFANYFVQRDPKQW